MDTDRYRIDAFLVEAIDHGCAHPCLVGQEARAPQAPSEGLAAEKTTHGGYDLPVFRAERVALQVPHEQRRVGYKGALEVAGVHRQDTLGVQRPHHGR